MSKRGRVSASLSTCLSWVQMLVAAFCDVGFICFLTGWPWRTRTPKQSSYGTSLQFTVCCFSPTQVRQAAKSSFTVACWSWLLNIVLYIIQISCSRYISVWVGRCVAINQKDVYLYSLCFGQWSPVIQNISNQVSSICGEDHGRTFRVCSHAFVCPDLLPPAAFV